MSLHECDNNHELVRWANARNCFCCGRFGRTTHKFFSRITIFGEPMEAVFNEH